MHAHAWVPLKYAEGWRTRVPHVSATARASLPMTPLYPTTRAATLLLLLLHFLSPWIHPRRYYYIHARAPREGIYTHGYIEKEMCCAVVNIDTRMRAHCAWKFKDRVNFASERGFWGSANGWCQNEVEVVWAGRDSWLENHTNTVRVYRGHEKIIV